MAIYWGAFMNYTAPGGKQYDGQAINAGDSSVPGCETAWGKSMSILHWATQTMSGGVNKAFPTASMNNASAGGRIVMLNLGTWDLSNHANDINLSMNNIVNGATALMPDGTTTIDSYFTTWFTAAKSWGKPFLFRLWQEFNFNTTNPQFPWAIATYSNWQGSGKNWTNSTSDWIAAWQHLHTLCVNAGASNVTWVWNPNVRGTSGSTSTLTYASMYPGDNYVDWIGVDGYNPGANGGEYASYKQIIQGDGSQFRDSYDEITTLTSRPIIVCETNADDRLPGGGITSTTPSYSSQATWWTTALGTDLRTSLPQIKAFCFAELDFGTAGWYNSTAAAGSTTTVINITSGYAPATNSLVGNGTGLIVFVSGANNGVSRTISANTTTTITVSSAFGSAPAAGDHFYVGDGSTHNSTFAYGSGGTVTTAGTAGVKTAVGSPYLVRGAAGLGSLTAIADRIYPGNLQKVVPYEALRQQQAFVQALRNSYPSQQVAWWMLNETSGTSAADSVGTNTGTYSSPTFNQSPIGRGLLKSLSPATAFAGTTTSHVSIPNASVFSPNAQQVSIALVVKPGNLAAKQWYLTKGASSNFEWAIGNDASGLLNIVCWNLAASTQVAVNVGAIAAGTNLILVTFNPSTTPVITAWLNGATTASTSGATALAMGTGTASVFVAGRADNDSPSNATLQHILVLNNAAWIAQDSAELWAALNKQRPNPRVVI